MEISTQKAARSPAQTSKSFAELDRNQNAGPFFTRILSKAPNGSFMGLETFSKPHIVEMANGKPKSCEC